MQSYRVKIYVLYAVKMCENAFGSLASPGPLSCSQRWTLSKTLHLD